MAKPPRLLLFTILEQESIQVSISHPEVQYLGKILISCCHAQTIGRDGADKDYYLTSWRSFSHLLLGGVTLETNECPERPSSSSNADVSLSVGHWRTRVYWKEEVRHEIGGLLEGWGCECFRGDSGVCAIS